MCQSEGVAFFFVESWVGLDWKRLYVAYAVVGQRRFFFFFGFVGNIHRWIWGALIRVWHRKHRASFIGEVDF